MDGLREGKDGSGYGAYNNQTCDDEYKREMSAM